MPGGPRMAVEISANHETVFFPVVKRVGRGVDADESFAGADEIEQVLAQAQVAFLGGRLAGLIHGGQFLLGRHEHVLRRVVEDDGVETVDFVGFEVGQVVAGHRRVKAPVFRPISTMDATPHGMDAWWNPRVTLKTRTLRGLFGTAGGFSGTAAEILTRSGWAAGFARDVVPSVPINRAAAMAAV